MSQRALVTGGAGFIGSHLVDRLVANGDGVSVIDSLETQVHGDGPGNRNDDAHYVIDDLASSTGIDGLLADADVVYHLASVVGIGQSMYEVERYARGNLLATARLLDRLVNVEHGVRRLVLAASMSSYGEGRYRCGTCGDVAPDVRPTERLRSGRWEPACPVCGHDARPVATTEETPLRPTSIYASQKRAQEEMALLIGRTYGISTVPLRLFNVYGPRQSLGNPYTGVCAIFSARIRNGNPPVVYEDGAQTRDFVHVADVARAFQLAGTRSAGGQPINIGTGAPRTIRAVAEELLAAHGSRLRPDVSGTYRAGDIRHCWADTRRAQDTLGWTPEVRFPDGIRGLVAWNAPTLPSDRFAQAERELDQHELTGGRPAVRTT